MTIPALLTLLLAAGPAFAGTTTTPKGATGAPAYAASAAAAVPSGILALPSGPLSLAPAPPAPTETASPVGSAPAPLSAAPVVQGAVSAPIAAAAPRAAVPAPQPAASAIPGTIAKPGRPAVSAAASVAQAAGKARVAGGLKDLVDAFGVARQPEALAAASAPAATLPASKRLTSPITITHADGSVHPLSFNPAVPEPSRLKRLWLGIKNLPTKISRIRRFADRVKRSVNEEITDENLQWSIDRLGAMRNQEGILRNRNTVLINKWDASALRDASPADLKDSSLDSEDIMRLFKTAMDLEEPTLQYQFAFAQNLHPMITNLAHFLGTTMQERILVVALKGRAANMAVWSDEEKRHGPILEKVYEKVRDPQRPPLVQQGEGPRLPRLERGAALAISNMGNRALAELFAAAAYQTLRGNAATGSPMERALEGVYRDEVYHYVIMQLVSKWALGQHSRWYRLYKLLRHNLDYRTPPATDKVIHRRGMSLTLILENLYTILAIDKRVDRFLRSIPEAEARALIGEVNVTDEQIRAAAERKNNTVTKHFTMEQNPELTQQEVETLGRRFPGYIDPSKRFILASDIKDVIDGYRQNSLTRPEYWMRKKGFAKAAATGPGIVLERALGNEPDKAMSLDFPSAQAAPTVRIVDRTGGGSVTLFEASFDTLSMLQIGVLMDAESMKVLEQLEAAKKDLTYTELVKKLGSAGYQSSPLPVVDDLR